METDLLHLRIMVPGPESHLRIKVLIDIGFIEFDLHVYQQTYQHIISLDFNDLQFNDFCILLDKQTIIEA